MDASHVLDYGNTTRTILKGRALLFGVILAGDGAAADLQLYDGAGSGDPQKLHLEALAGTTSSFMSPFGVLLLNGIHVVVNASTSKYSVEYIPLPS